jgi:hypothetical protein
MMVSTLSKTPPRSFAMLQEEYGYDSSSFWDIVPTITCLLLIIALITNWKTKRRKLILFALAPFITGGLLPHFFPSLFSLT